MSEEFKKLVEEAKERFSDDKEIMEVLEEMEADVSESSIIKGTIITLNHCEER
jgi:hypothetical protein